MNAQLIIKGMRPKTLVAGLVPPVMAYGVYLNQEQNGNIYYLILCVLLALFIQIATNFYNDAIDYLKGADEKRVGPERIATQDGVNYKKVFYIGHFFILLSFCVGVPLVIEGGTVILALGIISLFLAYGYTGGPFPLAYLGLGELFVFIFFGLVATCGSFYIYAGEVNLESIIVGTQVGLLSSVLIAINNFRDRKTDVEVNKRTLATRMSRENYLKMIDFFLFFPYALLIILVVVVKISYFIPILAIGQAYQARHIVHNYVKEEELNSALALSGKHLMIFGGLFFLASLWN